MNLPPNTRLGEYEIRSLIGAGGMGEVYRAHDTRLGRDVALKVLPRFVAADPDRQARFEQEARAAAALNHPNILSVHQLGTYEGVPYLVSELLDGDTLRGHLARGGISVRQAVDYLAQAARGLAAAHEKGIVHRDLKPENLFVTADGRMKILDFGLAKMVQLRAASGESVATFGSTEPGVVMGTAGYMAPEQVRGALVDCRADIFALGAILYEVLTNRRAFHKPTPIETMNAVLNEEPPGVGGVAPGIPLALQRIVQRCLDKNPDRRFQSSSDLAFALEALSDSGSDRAVTVAPASAAAGSRGWKHAGLLAGAALVAVTVFLLLKPRSALVPTAEWVQLTDFADSVTSPAFSPDGRMLTFLRGDDAFVTAGQVYVMLLPTGRPVPLTNDSMSKMSPVFSPDGATIAYTVPWDTWTVPALGGQPRRWLPNASGLTWLDADSLLFSQVSSGIHMELVTSTLNRTGTRTIYSPAAQNGMAHRSYLSPDRKWVLVVEMTGNLWNRCRLVPADGSGPGRPVGPADGACTAAAWSRDGTWMYLNSNAGRAYHIWRQRLSNDRLEQITAGPTEEVGIAMAPDGQSLVTSVGLRRTSVWLHDARGERMLTSEATAALGDPRNGSPFSHDGRTIYYLVQRTSMRQVNPTTAIGELWALDLQSGDAQVVLPGFSITEFSLSPDRREVVFSAIEEEAQVESIWIAPLDRSASPRKLRASANRARYAPGFVYYLKRPPGGGYGFAYRMRPDGTGDEQIWHEEMLSLATSPDGRYLAMNLPVAGPHAWKVQITEWGSKHVQPVCNDCLVYWSDDGGSLLVSTGTGKIDKSASTYVIGLAPGAGVPALPEGGFSDVTQFAGLETARVVPARLVAPGPTPDIYAFAKESIQRNLYRIPLR